MITMVAEMAGVTAEQYDEVCRLANVSQGNMPPGLIFHSASPTTDGWLVVDVWDSAESFAAFGEHLMPAAQQVGMTGLEPKIYPTHAIMKS